MLCLLRRRAIDRGGRRFCCQCAVNVSCIYLFISFLHMASTFLMMSFSHDGLVFKHDSPLQSFALFSKPLRLFPSCLLYLSLHLRVVAQSHRISYESAFRTSNSLRTLAVLVPNAVSWFVLVPECVSDDQAVYSFTRVNISRNYTQNHGRTEPMVSLRSSPFTVKNLMRSPGYN